MHPHSDPRRHSHTRSLTGHNVRSLTWGSDDRGCDVCRPHSSTQWCSHNEVTGTYMCNVPCCCTRGSYTIWGTPHRCGQCHPLGTYCNKILIDLDPALSLAHACCASSLLHVQWGHRQ
jgi:hypothetical protein